MKRILSVILLGLYSSLSFGAEISARIQLNVIDADSQLSWQRQGTGILREDHSDVNLQQGLIKVQQALLPGLEAEAVINLHQDGERHLGLTQAKLQYKPLSASPYKFRARAGFFYPEMSFENPDTGWLSPYTYTQSAINSWLGEELRLAGLEMGLYSPGRQRRSPWSWEIYAGAFRGNDPLGTLLSWRGWAMHDRQSLHHDRIQFAPYPAVTDRIDHPAWVEPFHEIDGRTGFYIGGHLDYFKKTRLRYYYYDNNADPLAVNHQRLYAWHTRFHSLAFSHQLNSDTRLLGQWMDGTTEMGRRWVYAEFDAWYLMLSHRTGRHRFSLRYDHFTVTEDDIWPWDYNHSDGEGLTVNWRYHLNKNWQLGLEHHINSNTAVNRMTLSQAVSVDQQQSLAVLEFRWH
ncbi:hypothetical protein [Lacimicrobium alkaliphilum]|uniref:Uncharacterized protein n=1 Tax=Lacimicrobium alkaliphilum TaxID=1526571 RepID=A0A0U2PJ03_9ALTE|nr:hypothetical protein [Lacimicrobium alkaliphilum]ALS99501.1 hypothetical protein AT746_15370 [Lacimicrobium alkaliphilum]